jgi:hypothetical protein
LRPALRAERTSLLRESVMKPPIASEISVSRQSISSDSTTYIRVCSISEISCAADW